MNLLLQQSLVLQSGLTDNPPLLESDENQANAHQDGSDDTVDVRGILVDQDLPHIGQDDIQESHGGSRTRLLQLQSAVDADLSSCSQKRGGDQQQPALHARGGLRPREGVELVVALENVNQHREDEDVVDEDKHRHGRTNLAHSNIGEGGSNRTNKSNQYVECIQTLRSRIKNTKLQLYGTTTLAST